MTNLSPARRKQSRSFEFSQVRGLHPTTAMIWDLYQHYRLNDLETRLAGAQAAASGGDAAARRQTAQLEERVDRLVLLCRALFELLGEKAGMTEEQLGAKILEIDLRDGQQDGRMSPRPTRCPTCDAMISPRFGRCLFCGEKGPNPPLP